MNRMIKIGLMGLAMTAAMQTAALAQYGSKVSRFVNELRSQGYRNVEIERTIMGRYKIEAKKGGVSREIVIDPNTGHVFRDRSENENSHGSNGGYSSNDSDYDRDGDYDDRDGDYDDRDDDHDDRDDHNDRDNDRDDDHDDDHDDD